MIFLKINMHEEKNQSCCLPFSMEKIQHHLFVKEFLKNQYKQNVQSADSVLHGEAKRSPPSPPPSKSKGSGRAQLPSCVPGAVSCSRGCWNKANHRELLGQGGCRFQEQAVLTGSSRWLSVGWCSLQSVPGAGQAAPTFLLTCAVLSSPLGEEKLIYWSWTKNILHNSPL